MGNVLNLTSDNLSDKNRITIFAIKLLNDTLYEKVFLCIDVTTLVVGGM